MWLLKLPALRNQIKSKNKKIFISAFIFSFYSASQQRRVSTTVYAYPEVDEPAKNHEFQHNVDLYTCSACGWFIFESH